MPKKDSGDEVLRCSFCNKSQREVKKLIAGPTVFICDECVDICLDIIAEDRMLEQQQETNLPKPHEIKKVLVFDEHYVSQFVFQPDEVLKNSFEIFINTPEYQTGIEQLEAIFEGLKMVFVENEALDDVIVSLTELRNAFTVTRSGSIAV